MLTDRTKYESSPTCMERSSGSANGGGLLDGPVSVAEVVSEHGGERLLRGFGMP